MGPGAGKGTHHVLENVAQLIHTVRVVAPNLMHRFQKPLPFMTLLHGILLQSGREGGMDGFLRQPIEVLNDKVPDAIIEFLSVLTHYQLVSKSIALLERELVCVVVLNFTDV